METGGYNGLTVKGKQTRRFKLVEVGYCPNFGEVRERLNSHGSIPEGQWREPFKITYPKPDGKGPIGFADPSWVGPDDDAFFPYVSERGGSDFDWTIRDFCKRWRWFVEVVEPTGQSEPVR